MILVIYDHETIEMNIHTETFNAFKQAGVPEEYAQRAATAVAGDQNAIIEKLTKMENDIANRFIRFENDITNKLIRFDNEINTKLVKMENDINNKFVKMEGDIEKRFTKLEHDIREDTHSLDKKFLIITTIVSSTLPIIGGMLFFVLKALN